MLEKFVQLRNYISFIFFPLVPARSGGRQDLRRGPPHQALQPDPPRAGGLHRPRPKRGPPAVPECVPRETGEPARRAGAAPGGGGPGRAAAAAGPAEPGADRRAAEGGLRGGTGQDAGAEEAPPHTGLQGRGTKRG